MWGPLLEGRSYERAKQSDDEYVARNWQTCSDILYSGGGGGMGGGCLFLICISKRAGV